MIAGFSPGSITSLILDMDGVLWRGDQPIGDLPGVFNKMQHRGLKVVLATNNATLTVSQYQEKLLRFGVVVEEWQVVNSPLTAAYYLKQRYPQGGSVYVVGEHGLVETLEQSGYPQLQTNGTPLAVIAGMDRNLTYDKLKLAMQYIRQGALFIGTNPDRTFPIPDGLAPGAGAILAALEAATDVKPIIMGKPQPEMYRVALDRLESQASETLVVGDRIETDIAGGQALGCPTALVLSGVTSEAQALAWSPPPSLIALDLDHVIEHL